MRYYTALQAILLSPVSSRAFSFLSSSTAAGAVSSTIAAKNNNSRDTSCRMASNDAPIKNLVVDPFCFRQFSEKESSKGYAGAVL